MQLHYFALGGAATMIPILILAAVLSGFSGPTALDAMAGSPTITAPTPPPGTPQSADAMAGSPTATTSSGDAMAGSPTIVGPH
jgi:hypothetical protein